MAKALEFQLQHPGNPPENLGPLTQPAKTQNEKAVCLGSYIGFTVKTSGFTLIEE